MLSLLIQLRMRPPTALMRITSPSPGTTLFGLTTMRPVAILERLTQAQER
jgi:hypothetical protein